VASLLVGGFAFGFAIAAAPGPIFFLCLRRTLVKGWLSGLFSGFGVATADGIYAALAAFGLGAVTSVLTGERRVGLCSYFSAPGSSSRGRSRLRLPPPMAPAWPGHTSRPSA
jgi:hypothetical protein